MATHNNQETVKNKQERWSKQAKVVRIVLSVVMIVSLIIAFALITVPGAEFIVMTILRVSWFGILCLCLLFAVIHEKHRVLVLFYSVIFLFFLLWANYRFW